MDSILSQDAMGDIQVEIFGCHVGEALGMGLIEEDMAGHFGLDQLCCGGVVADERIYRENLVNAFRQSCTAIDWEDISKKWKERCLEWREDGEMLGFFKPKDIPIDNQWSTDFNDDTVLKFMEIASAMDQLQKMKSVHYKDSWRKRGEIGVFMNIARKFDRLQSMVEHAARGFDLDETALPKDEALEETLADLAIYCVKYMALRKEKFPKKYLEWKRRNAIT